MLRRFVFVISDTGGGHRASAGAVQHAMERAYGDAAAVDVADILVETTHWPFYRWPQWYTSLAKFDSVPWGVVWHLTDHPRFFQRTSHLIGLYARPSLERFLRRHPADVLVLFHPAPTHVLMLTARRMRLRVPTVVVVTDLASGHAGWFAPGALKYLVPSEEVERQALIRGVPPGRVEVTGGVPVHPDFAEAQEMSKAEARSKLGLPQALPLVLVVGGGEGMGPMVPAVRAIAARRPQAYLAAIAGRNHKMYEQLRSLDLPVGIRVEGFVTNMEVWMRAADLLVTKAGPNTLCEAFVCGLPVILYAALRGQEEDNVKYVVRHGLGVWAPRPEQTAEQAMSLLSDPTRRQAMVARARALVNPDVAQLAARRIWDASQQATGRSRER